MPDQLIDDVLDDYRRLTKSVIANYLPDKEPRRHLYHPVADYPSREGKMMRPALCIAVARCFGAPAELAAPVAAGIELLHNALLIHDDIEDESEYRRGQPTLHMKYNLPIALNASDMLALISFRPLAGVLPRIGPGLGRAFLSEIDRMAQETAEGQAMELGWRFDNATDLAAKDYLEMVLKKTCWLATIHPCRVGALLGLGHELDAERFVRFGFFMGAAFQIKDDILNIEPVGQNGKELCGDLLEGKRTLMLLDLMQRLDGAQRARLMHFLALPRDERPPDDVAWIRQRMIEEGCLDRARAAAEGLVGAARHEFDLAFGQVPDSRDKAFIRELPSWTLSRTH